MIYLPSSSVIFDIERIIFLFNLQGFLWKVPSLIFSLWHLSFSYLSSSWLEFHQHWLLEILHIFYKLSPVHRLIFRSRPISPSGFPLGISSFRKSSFVNWKHVKLFPVVFPSTCYLSGHGIYHIVLCCAL